MPFHYSVLEALSLYVPLNVVYIMDTQMRLTFLFMLSYFGVCLQEAVYEVCQACNVTEREVFAALIANDPSDQLCVAYHLIIDNK